jgi:hypothetical protein
MSSTGKTNSRFTVQREMFNNQGYTSNTQVSRLIIFLFNIQFHLTADGLNANIMRLINSTQE